MGVTAVQFILDGGVYKVSRITGPTHNFLGIRLGDGGNPVEVVALPVKQGEPQRVEKDDVLKQVLAGLRDINSELDKEYQASEVFFLPSDTPSGSVYKFLTVELIKRIEEGGDFLIA